MQLLSKNARRQRAGHIEEYHRAKEPSNGTGTQGNQKNAGEKSKNKKLNYLSEPKQEMCLPAEKLLSCCGPKPRQLWSNF